MPDLTSESARLGQVGLTVQGLLAPLGPTALTIPLLPFFPLFFFFFFFGEQLAG
jgi:hypothetical protein